MKNEYKIKINKRDKKRKTERDKNQLKIEKENNTQNGKERELERKR